MPFAGSLQESWILWTEREAFLSCDLLNVLRGIPHGNADMGPLYHRNIIAAVTNGHRLLELINQNPAALRYEIKTAVMDATDLSLFEDGAFDVVLNMGPFYHLSLPYGTKAALARPGQNDPLFSGYAFDKQLKTEPLTWF